MRAARRLLPITLLFVLLTIVMTWPQALRLATHTREHHDVYFNMWRLGWIAHALATSPSRLFDGNQFNPEPRVLTFSDAMLVEGIIAAPLLWAGLPMMLVHNLLLLGAMAASGVGAFVLARRLTGSAAAAITAGMVFAFAPFRFEHYMHMELQWAMWTPWAFWALHRTVATGTLRNGLLTGLFIALQMASSIYYGVFLITLLSPAAVLILVTAPRESRMRAVMPLAAGALLAGVLCGVYALPYLETRGRVGERPTAEILTYSATAANYGVATTDNLLYGGRPGRSERRLFPGLLPVALALTGLFIRRPSRAAVIYLVALAAAFEMSLGLGGYSYRLLYEYVQLIGGLRAPARMAICVLLFLGVLAAYGQSALEAVVSSRARRVLAVVVPALIMLEYWVAPLTLVPFPSKPPQVYAWLATQPRGIVAEFPMPRADTLPGDEPRHIYMSTFHWMPMVNGYSGYYPQSYLARIEAMRGFPSAEAVAQLQRERVRYVIIHTPAYSRAELDTILAGMSSLGVFTELARLDAGRGPAYVYGLR